MDGVRDKTTRCPEEESSGCYAELMPKRFQIYFAFKNWDMIKKQLSNQYTKYCLCMYQMYASHAILNRMLQSIYTVWHTNCIYRSVQSFGIFIVNLYRIAESLNIAGDIWCVQTLIIFSVLARIINWCWPKSVPPTKSTICISWIVWLRSIVHEVSISIHKWQWYKMSRQINSHDNRIKASISISCSAPGKNRSIWFQARNSDGNFQGLLRGCTVQKGVYSDMKNVLSRGVASYVSLISSIIFLNKGKSIAGCQWSNTWQLTDVIAMILPNVLYFTFCMRNNEIVLFVTTLKYVHQALWNRKITNIVFF